VQAVPAAVAVPGDTPVPPAGMASAATAHAGVTGVWSPEAERELGKIPFFVRNKARRNTERYAHDAGVQTITVETLYEAKAHFSR
jgi:light-independent protochlorophyllide reductase subunit B